MKPFDLKKALAGEPVVTGDGYTVKISGYLKEAQPYYNLVGWVMCDNPYSNSWNEKGLSYTGCDKSETLFMATKTVKKEGWVNLLKDCEPISKTYIVKTSSKVYADEGSALNRKNDCFPYEYIATVKIEWEEEI